MTRRGIAGIALAGLIVLAGALLLRGGGQPSEDGPAPRPASAQPRSGPPTLYCEFTNFADRTPLVGFYFSIEEERPSVVYAQIFQRERDGEQSDFGGPDAPRPEWTFDGSANPALLQAPGDDTQINLYDYDTKKPGVNWYEAGLRSIRYRNLGGKCRRSAA